MLGAARATCISCVIVACVAGDGETEAEHVREAIAESTHGEEGARARGIPAVYAQAGIVPGHPQPNGPTTPPHPLHPPHPQAQVITVDQRPLVLHLLIGLCRAGLERAVVAVGDGAELIETAVREAELPIQVSYVTVPPSLWRNLANSILMCKAAFKTDEPLLIVRSDYLFDWRLLQRMT